MEKPVEVSEEAKVEMTMTTQATKISEADLAALREQVEMLELRVRKAKALEFLQTLKANRSTAKKG